MKRYYLLFFLITVVDTSTAMDGGQQRAVRPYDHARDYNALCAIIGSECVTAKKVDGESASSHECASFLAPSPLKTAQRFFENDGDPSVDCIGFRTTCHTLVCCDKKEPVGFVGYDLLERTFRLGPFSHDAGTIARIYLLAVAEKKRRRGHAKALMQAVIADAGKRGAQNTMLARRENDHVMALFCKSMRFSEGSRVGEDVVYLYDHRRSKQE